LISRIAQNAHKTANKSTMKFVARIIYVLLSSFWLRLALNDYVTAETFKLGYLTGSQRKPGDMEYTRPGLTISGAITIAVNEVNAVKLKPYNHTIEIVVAETYGDEEISIKQTATLWTQGVAGYIGPQETCNHEGRMAAAFNLPMISYFCTHHETSNKKYFPTFGRTRPPETQISKSVVSLLSYFNWTQVSFFYLNDNEFIPVADTILAALKENGLQLRSVMTWDSIYHHGYMRNPFDSMIEQTYMDTRSE
jgi:Receptor family ligand binding region